METALAFVGAIVVSYWFLCILVCVILWNVHLDNDGWAIIWLAALTAAAYFAFTVSWQTIAIAAAVYIPIGLIWSIYRWKRHCKTALEDYQDSKERIQSGKENNSWDNKLERRQEDAKKLMNPAKNIDRIASWVIVWPFSLIDNIIGDLIDMVRDIIKKYLIRIYDTIAGKYLKEIN
jgi:hypothetical protein